MAPRRPRHYYKQNRIQQLAGFYHVAISGSFSAAADSMSLAQSTVSLRVQALERELQTRLFERRRGGIALTLAGQTLFGLAAPLVESLEALDRAFHDELEQVEAGRVVCVAPDGILVHLLSRALTDFIPTHPRIEAEFLSAQSQDRALEMVLHGDADMGIAAPSTIPDIVTFHPLASYNNYFVVPLGHPTASRATVNIADMAKYPLVAPLQAGQFWRNLEHLLEMNDLHWRVVARMGNPWARFHYVISGLGVTVATGDDVADELSSKLAWIPIAERNLPASTYGLMTRKDAYLSPPAKKLAESILASAPTFQSLPGIAKWSVTQES